VEQTGNAGAPLVYLQFDESQQIYANSHVRQILAHSINFIAGENP